MKKKSKRFFSAILIAVLLVGSFPTETLIVNAQCVEHKLVDAGVQVQPTCTSTGLMSVRCTNNCSYWGTRVLPKTDHNYEEYTVQPTSTNSGYTCEKCSVCGTERNVVTIPAIGESMDVPVLKFSAVSSSSIVINWEKSTSGATSYILYGSSSPSGVAYTQLYTTGGQSSYSYKHSQLKRKTKYYYKLRAVNDRTGHYVDSIVYTETTKDMEEPTLSFSNITTDSISMNWNRTQYGTYYELYYSTSLSESSYEKLYEIGAATSFSYTHKNLKSNTTYYYKLVAYDGQGNSKESVRYTKKTNAEAVDMEKPELYFSGESTSAIFISWENSRGATSYILYGSTSQSGAAYTQLYTTGGQSSYSFKHSGLKRNTKYYYKLRAVDNRTGHYVDSIIYTKSTKDMEEPILSFSNITTDSISMNWNRTEGATYYELYYSTSLSESSYEMLYEIGAATSFSYTHKNLKSNTTYYYKLVAYDGHGNSKESQRYTKKTNAQAVTIETPVLSFSDIKNTLITISWERSQSADYYILYGCASESGIDYEEIYTMGGQSTYSYTHTGLTKNTKYYYKLRAVNAISGNYVDSIIYTKTTDNFEVPKLRVLDVTKTSINIIWDKSNDATSYKLYCCDSAKGDNPVEIYYSGGQSRYSYLHYNLSSDTTYYYMLEAINDRDNSSEFSDVCSFKTEAMKVPSLSFSNITDTSITINWDKGDGVYYILYGCDSESGVNFTKLYTMGGQSAYSYTHSGLNSNTTYYYKLEAVDSKGKAVSSIVYSKSTSGFGNYLITYDANGGTGAPGQDIKIQGMAYTISDVVPTKENYNFVGWSTSKNSSNPTYFPGGVYTGNVALNLYAVWDDIAFDTNDSVSYEGNDYLYYQDGKNYTVSNVSLNPGEQGVHTFRILSEATVEITITTSNHSNISTQLYSYPFNEYSSESIDIASAKANLVKIGKSSMSEKGTYLQETYTYSTNPNYKYNGGKGYDEYYDYAFIVTNNGDDTVTYSCKFVYNYPSEEQAPNGGYWSGSYVDNISQAGATPKTGLYVPYYDYNVSGKSYSVDPFETAFSDYWFLTAEQKEQWLNIVNYIYGDDMIYQYKQEAWRECIEKIMLQAAKKVVDKIKRVSPEAEKTLEDLLDKMFPERSLEERLWMLVYTYIEKGDENFLESAQETTAKVAMECCESIMEEFGLLLNEPAQKAEEIEKDIKEAAKNGTLPNLLKRLSDAIDDGTIMEIYEKRVMDATYEELWVDMMKEVIKTTVTEGAKELGEDALNCLLPGSKVFIEHIYPVMDALLDVGVAYSWCGQMAEFLDDINDACKLCPNGIQVNALTARYFYEEYRNSAYQNINALNIQFSCKAWNGNTIPYIFYHDLIGDVLVYE